MKVYIAGPITGVINYRDNFKRVEKELKKQGHTPINPAVLPDGLKDYMKICKAMLDNADAAVFLNGWESSVGATEERDYCNQEIRDIFIFEENELFSDFEEGMGFYE